ncbi:unnamed protein product, partial [Ilex paraguariensis]
CPWAVVVWRLSSLAAVAQLDISNPREWLYEAHQILTPDDYSLFLILCWLVWRNRNIRIFEDVVQDPSKVSEYA